jgi:hypothetical protein
MPTPHRKIVFRALAIFLGWAFLAANPAIAQVTPEQDVPETGPLSGYMDFHFNKADGEDAILDFHRFVLLMNHSFSSRIRFVGELELEHAFVEGLEEAGELELEQAYVDFLLSRSMNVRAGMLLMPVGIINERHEPPVYNGVERPFVDTVIVPSTWFDVGAGIHGELGRGWRYRAYAVAPLNALEFSADEGIRGGAQKGSEANVRNLAYTGRVEFRAVESLTLGASVWTGDSSFAAPRLDTSVTLGEFDARFRRDRVELRWQFAQVHIGDAEQLNDSIGRTVGVSPNVASTLRGFYGEAAYRLWNAGAPRDLVVFGRYENFDTQFRMPGDGIPLKEFDRDAWVTGITYYPDPDVAVKADHVYLRNQSGLFPNRHLINLGLGWWF